MTAAGLRGLCFPQQGEPLSLDGKLLAHVSLAWRTVAFVTRRF